MIEIFSHVNYLLS